MLFKIYEFDEIVLLRKTFGDPVFMLPYPLFKIAGNARIKDFIRPVGDEIHSELFHLVRFLDFASLRSEMTKFFNNKSFFVRFVFFFVVNLFLKLHA